MVAVAPSLLHNFWTLKMGCDVVFWDVATSSTTQALTLSVLLQTHDHTCSMDHTICHTCLKNKRKIHVKVLNVRLEVGHNDDCSVAHHQQGVGWHDLAHNMSKTSVTSITHLCRCNLPFNVESAHTTHGMPSWGDVSTCVWCDVTQHERFHECAC